MDKNMIYQTAFEEIRDSSEWGNSCKDNNYAWYIDGVISITNRMLEKLDEAVESENEELSFG